MEYWKQVLEIGILFVIFYSILHFMKRSRGEGILKGIGLIFLIAYVVLLSLAKRLNLEELDFLLTNLLTFFVFGLIIIFQPELRRGLIRLGQTSFRGHFSPKGISIFDEVIQAVLKLSRQKIGALIAIEGEVGLKREIEGGVLLNAQVCNQLIETIFYPGTPLHDGAVIIVGNTLVAASCLFPLTESAEISKELGTRHRAGVGVTEESDAIAIIVSEETGSISIAHRGKLYRNLDREKLKELLNELYVGP